MSSSSSARLRWGIKRSLINYVSDVYDGAIEASDGATSDDERVFTFDPDPSDEAGPRRFRGRIILTAHDDMLRIELADPWLEHDGENTILSVFSPMDDRRVAMAALTQIDDESWSATLTPRGADVLGPQYFSGTEIDPVHLVQSRAD